MKRKSSEKLRSFFAYSIIILIITEGSVFSKVQTDLNPDKTEDSDEDKELKKDLPNSKGYKQSLRVAATTLNQIVKESLSSHPSIIADKEAVGATDDVLDQAIAGYMPTVDMRMSIGRENIRRNFAVDSLNPLPSVGSLSSTRSDPSITIRQILFDGMGTTARVNRARFQRRQALGTLGVTTDTAMVDAATAAIDVRRLQRLLRIVNGNIQFHEIMKNRVAEIVEAGAAPISDLYQVKARLQDTFVSKANIQADLEVAQAKFIEVVGKEPPTMIKRIFLPSHLIPASPEIAIKMAFEHSNNLKVAKSNVHIAETTHQETASKLVPTLTFEVEGERDRNLNGTTGVQSRLTAMVVARHNIFNGGADMARSRETVKRLTEAHARLNLVRRQTERTIRATWGEAKSARAKSARLTRLIREKRQVRNTYLTEFTVGKRTLIDILDAANDVFITEATRAAADATSDINIITLSVGTGKFKEFLQRPDFQAKEGNEEGLGSAEDYQEPTMHQASYRVPKQMAAGKNTSLKRKSIFERRKKERQDMLQSSLSFKN